MEIYPEFRVHDLRKCRIRFTLRYNYYDNDISWYVRINSPQEVLCLYWEQWQARSKHIWSGQARFWVWSIIVGVVSHSGYAQTACWKGNPINFYKQHHNKNLMWTLFDSLKQFWAKSSNCGTVFLKIAQNLLLFPPEYVASGVPLTCSPPRSYSHYYVSASLLYSSLFHLLLDLFCHIIFFSGDFSQKSFSFAGKFPTYFAMKYNA